MFSATLLYTSLILLSLKVSLTTNLKLIDKSGLRVHQGVPIKEGEYPYVIIIGPSTVDIRFTIYRDCTGNLITPIWVLTAAYCLGISSSDVIEIDKRVYFANYTTMPDNNYRDVVQTIRHPLYSKKYYRNDIGLAKITPLYLPVGKLSGVDYISLIGYSVKYIGTGNTFNDASVFSANNTYLDVLIADQRKMPKMGEGVVVRCDIEISRTKILSSTLCIQSKCDAKEQRIRSGDSGGPVIYKEKIVGIAACAMGYFEFRCYFTAVSPFLEWIQDVIGTPSRKRKRKKVRRHFIPRKPIAVKFYK